MDGLLLNTFRNDLCNISTINLATFGDIWNFLESGNWKSGNSRKLASFGQFQYIGYFSHSVQVTELDFELGISNFSGIWKLEIWKSGNSRKLTSLGQFQYIGYFSHSVQVTELDFELRISKFPFFWIFSGNFLEIWKFSGICFFTNFYVWEL